MALFDKVKSQAGQVAQQAAERAKSASAAGQAKFDALAAKRQLDSLLRDLGQLVYAERTGRSSSGDQEAINRVVAQITELEQPPNGSSDDGAPSAD